MHYFFITLILFHVIFGVIFYVVDIVSLFTLLNSNPNLIPFLLASSATASHSHHTLRLQSSHSSCFVVSLCTYLPDGINVILVLDK